MNIQPFHPEHPNKKHNDSLRGVTTLDDMRDAGEIKDSGKGPRVFATGAQRDSSDGKERFDLLPITALARVAGHYEKGAKKYGENNWRKGMPRREFLKSCLRHLFKLLRGDVDEDHAAAVAWNILCFIETEELNLDTPDESRNAS